MLTIQTFIKAIFNKGSKERYDCFSSILLSINTICLIIIYVIFPIYIFCFISLPMWQLNDNQFYVNVYDTTCKYCYADNIIKIAMLLIAGSTSGYCALEIFGIDWLTDRHLTNNILLRIFGTCFETMFYICTYSFVTQSYSYSVLFAVVVRLIELTTFFFL
jgi:hypothetical protein